MCKPPAEQHVTFNFHIKCITWWLGLCAYVCVCVYLGDYRANQTNHLFSVLILLLEQSIWLYWQFIIWQGYLKLIIVINDGSCSGQYVKFVLKLEKAQRGLRAPKILTYGAIFLISCTFGLSITDFDEILYSDLVFLDSRKSTFGNYFLHLSVGWKKVVKFW